RLFIREVDLVAVPGASLWRLGVLAARLLARLALGLALGGLGLVLLLLELMALGRALLDLGLGLRHRAQSVFTPGDPRRRVAAIGHRRAVAALGQRQQRLHFLAQLRLDLVGVPPRQRAVLASVRVDLGAVQRDVPELEQL